MSSKCEQKLAAYREALAIMNNEKTDWKALCLSMAQTFPVSFVASAAFLEKKVNNGEPLWHVEAKQLLRDDQKIKAIKYCRMMTGWEIKEARDAVEALVY